MSTTPAPGRLGLAIVVLLGFWVLSWVLFIVGLGWPLSDFDTGGSGDGAVSNGLYVASALVYLASGPAAYRVSRRRWLLLAPLLLSAIWLISALATA